MKIAYTCPSYAPMIGGVETHVAQLARHVVSAGHEVDVLTEQHDDLLPSRDVLEGVTVRRFSVALTGWRYSMAPSLWRYIVRYGCRYDLIHAHSYHAFTSVGASLLRSRPLVFTPHYHGTGSTALGRFLHGPYRAVGTWLFHRSRAVICVSRAEAELVASHFPFVAGRMAIIPNGVDVVQFQSAAPCKQPFTVVLSAGRLKQYKNIAAVVHALSYLGPSFRLCVAGDGPALSDLRQLVSRLDLSGRVDFLGTVEDATLRRWYATASVYVSMSHQEAFGLTLLEALAAQTPVVASDIPAHREIKEMTGSDLLTLLPVGASAPELAAAIEQSIGRIDGATSFLPSWELVAEQTLRLYNSVLAAT